MTISSTQLTGQTLIDDDVLIEASITDFSGYVRTRGNTFFEFKFFLY